MAFDAQEFVDLLAHPEITVKRRSWGGLIGAALGLCSPTKTYRGRLLSHSEWLPMAETFLAATSGELSERETREAYGVYLDAIGIPRHVVFDLPPAAMLGALLDFFVCQKLAGQVPESVAKKAVDLLPHATDSPNGGKKKSRKQRTSSRARP